MNEKAKYKGTLKVKNRVKMVDDDHEAIEEIK
jgi:hypothetical protein